MGLARPAGRRRRMSPVARTLAVAGGILGVTLLARRAGYHLGTHTPVRCRQGHLFTTVWIPGVSVKSLRLGWWRLQFCPVGRHWSLVSPVRQSALTAEERSFVAEHRDVRIP